MRTMILVAFAILFPDPSDCASQEAQPSRRFFTVSAVDFWRDGIAGPKSTSTKERFSESIWAEPIRLKDGRYTTYLPPQPVLQFLENPTRETGLKYMAWQSERMEKMRKAAAILAGLQPKAAQAPKELRTPDVPVSITYFKKAGCPACAKQDAVLSDLKAKFPAVAIKPLEVGQEPQLWQRLDVKAVPALLIAVEGRPPVLLRGFADASKIVSVINGAPHEGK